MGIIITSINIKDNTKNSLNNHIHREEFSSHKKNSIPVCEEQTDGIDSLSYSKSLCGRHLDLAFPQSNRYTLVDLHSLYLI